MGLWRAMVERVARAGSAQALNVVAFSGGVDSSVVAALVYEAFPRNSVACLGVSAALPADQLGLARKIAGEIGIQLLETPTTEGEDPLYVENRGQSCYHCKTNLRGSVDKPFLFNGTNADDKLDPTRLGLIAASEFRVVSPLEDLSKAHVRALANERGLLNWNFAASPCLRSRLAFGVSATADHLKRVEAAETFARSFLQLAPQDNLRVRFLPQNHAAVELDAARHASVTSEERNTLAVHCAELGFAETVVRPFRSGSLSLPPPPGLTH
ncbi:hypothetical protein ACHHYP_05696 [Achlya hypogyna]|uniref:NAD/GMP synthase domain-containing protein n=1 Tax=Achlya hypogyna TaxID=1202772 RepID=A0A1V9YX19_ACHHY|nr:hypothetical protein ACHHYP_05696 [Achlya hypogyna]